MMRNKMRKKRSENMAEVLDKTLESVEKPSIDDMPLTCLRDYRLYNEAARKENKRLGVCRYKIKPCPVELHPKQTVKFMRNDQPANPLKVFKSDDIIHFEQTLVPGKTYELPEYIVHYLSDKGNPIWKWYDLPNGERETGISHYVPRFSLTLAYSERHR